MKTVLLTGHTSGLGRGFSEGLLDAGWRVLALARGAVQACRGLHQQRCDLARLDAIDDALGRLLADVERLDLVVLNAGVLGRIQPMARTSMEELQRIMDVNVWANKLILDRLAGGKPAARQVLAISSGAAVNASYGWGGYSLSKAALNTLIRLYAHELPDTHLTALAPGLVDTGMQDHLCAEVDAQDYPSVRKLIAARGTPAMPSPRIAAAAIIRLLPRLRAEFPSGSFVDIRDL